MPTDKVDVPHAGSYKSHQLYNQYELVEGLFHLPVAENPPEDEQELAEWSPVVTVRAFAPHRIRHVQFATKKFGAPPVIPSPETTGAFTFIGGAINFPAPILSADGTGFTWNVSGEYGFVETVRSSPDDGFVLGSDPIPNSVYQEMRKIYGGGGQPEQGAVASAGEEVRIGYAEGQAVDFSNSYYSYWSQSYFPAVFLHTGMLNGETVTPGVT